MANEVLERWRQDQSDTRNAGGIPWWRVVHVPRWSAALGGIGVVGLVGLGALGGTRLLQPPAGPPIVSSALTRPTTTMTATSSVAAAVPPPTAPVPTSPAPQPVAGQEVPPSRPDCAAATAVLSADVDGDGCAEELRYANGVLSADDDLRWQVGQVGDQVATGDWWCEGDRTLALLRPATGQAFVFAAWAGPGADLEAMAVGRADGASAVRAADLDGDGCGELVVERGALTPAVLPVPDRSRR